MMKNYGRACLAEFLEDRIVYRNLNPYDQSLPGLEQIRQQVGLPNGNCPRKNEPEYAHVIVHLLQLCRQQDTGKSDVRRLIFVGDTHLLDGTAYANLCRVGDWPGMAFIGSENSQPAQVKLATTETGQPLYLSNRWAALEDFDRHCSRQGIPISDGTAVVLDMDKTMVGARGRNGQVIDQARLDAVQDTVADLLGDAFDPAAFRAVYDPLNQPEFHPFTADNQDYLAYICLILGSGLYSFDELVLQVRNGRMASFAQFIQTVEGEKARLPRQLATIHQEILERFLAGDPTPFKAFRRTEYRTTVSRFGSLTDDASVESMLAHEIVITQELRDLAKEWRKRGALLFGLSDKPDEASIPTPTLAAQGYQPLHRAVTHAVGE